MRVAVTGASGVLGRAVTNHLHTHGVQVLPLSFSRTSPSPLYPNSPAPVSLDLLDSNAVRSHFTALQSNPETKVNFVIACAAERRPDVAEADPVRAEKLNKDSTLLLATLASDLGFGLVYISTDYVFDGANPPYSVGDLPNPLNLYGKLKNLGEEAVLAVRGQASEKTGEEKQLCVLRVPLLYGQVEYNSETAVNLFVDILEDRSGKQYTMDHFAVRFPTCVEDVARVIYDIINLSSIPPIIHYSSQRGLTKYEQLVIIAREMDVTHSHVTPDSEDPAKKPNPSGVQRPGNTQLDVEGLKQVGIETEETVSGGFNNWWKNWAQERRTVYG